MWTSTKCILFCLMAALGLSVVAGCRKDNAEETEAAEEQKEREALAIQNVLEALTDVVFDNDEETDFVFEGKTFEPTIGEVLDANAPSERSVFVEEASLSEPYFRSLVGDNRFVSETADGLVTDLTHLKLGKLTFHRQGEGNNSGYVSVEIPCVPHLTKIIYRTADQWGTNSFSSPCRRGDVYFGEGVYWVCVKESRSTSSPGTLVNMGAGKGQLFSNRWSELWEPRHGSGHDKSCRINDISDYLLLCADSKIYARKKQKIVAQFPGEVFPFACYSRDAKNQDFPTLGQDGFATNKDDYSHWSDYSLGRYKKVIMVLGAEHGSYKFLKGKKRYCQYVRIAPQCINNNGYSYDDKGYYGNGGKGNLYDFLNECFVYTMNSVHFTDKVPQGFTLVNI